MRDRIKDRGGDDLTGPNDGLELPCQNCGGFAPSNAKRCPYCGTEVDAEEESIETLLEELTSLLRDGDGDDEGEETTPRGEEPPEGVPDDMGGSPAGPESRVRYKKVRNWPP